MVIVNPPWGLREELESLLPYLAAVLGEAGDGHYRSRELAGD
jgi:23S rRNA (adenine2030-N6)-methyltransferase